MTAKGYPGFDYMRQTGSSTIFEAWECDVCRSCCHYALGATDSWTMTYLVGVHQLTAGYSEVKIDPQLPDGMEYVRYSIETIRGTIDIKFYRENVEIIKEISVPEAIKVIE